MLGDIIVAVDDKPVSTMNLLRKNKKIILKFWFLVLLRFWVFFNQVKNKAELMKILDEYSVGDKVTLKIKRGNEDLELKISLEEKSSWKYYWQHFISSFWISLFFPPLRIAKLQSLSKFSEYMYVYGNFFY